MTFVYCKLVQAGLRTLDQVPKHLREEVQRLLEVDDASE